MLGRGQAIRWRFFSEGTLPLQHEGKVDSQLTSWEPLEKHLQLIHVVTFDRQYAR